MRSKVFGILAVTCIVSLLIVEHYVLVPFFVVPVNDLIQSFNKSNLRKSVAYVEDTERFSGFTVIIVTFNEPLLEKTVNNVLENSNPKLLSEVLIIDDHSDHPVDQWKDDPRVRIIRTDTNVGLINARILGGNHAKGRFLAFIDAHVMVSPFWLETPYTYLSENPRTIVNFVNLNLNADTYKPFPLNRGIGSSASFTWGFGIFWGGGSLNDDFSPITMGMFSTTKYWWNQGQMDTGMGRWGSENIEISLRTWLCGGQIRVAKDSFVAHAFRNKFPYKVDNKDIIRNTVRVASVWMDGEYLERFYEAKKLKLKNGVPELDFGNITDRLELKKRLHCKPFSWYVDFFKDRAPCSQGGKCGSISTVSYSDLKNYTIESIFYK